MKEALWKSKTESFDDIVAVILISLNSKFKFVNIVREESVSFQM